MKMFRFQWTNGFGDHLSIAAFGETVEEAKEKALAKADEGHGQERGIYPRAGKDEGYDDFRVDEITEPLVESFDHECPEDGAGGVL